MFTGIIETIGELVKMEKEAENIHLSIRSTITSELKIDQSVAHNGVCLTVVKIEGDVYTVTAIKETILKSNFQFLKEGDWINLERCMTANHRVDGHFVQGHVDQTAVCQSVKEAGGSWYFTFEYESEDNVLVEKGSACVNGVSLTLVDVSERQFSVAIIPYTYEHTNFHKIVPGTVVNLEFDIIGKYITALFKKYIPTSK